MCDFVVGLGLGIILEYGLGYGESVLGIKFV